MVDEKYDILMDDLGVPPWPHDSGNLHESWFVIIFWTMGITWTANSRPAKVSPEIHQTEHEGEHNSCFLSIPIGPKCNQHISTTFCTLRPQEKILVGSMWNNPFWSRRPFAVELFLVMVPIGSHWFPCFQLFPRSAEPARVFLWKMLLAVLGGSTAQVRSSWMHNGELFMAAPNNGEVPLVFVERFRTRRGLGSLEFFKWCFMNTSRYCWVLQKLDIARLLGILFIMLQSWNCT